MRLPQFPLQTLVREELENIQSFAFHVVKEHGLKDLASTKKSWKHESDEANLSQNHQISVGQGERGC